MQNKNILWVLGGILILLSIFFFVFQNKQTQYSWRENYKETKNPYGTHVIYELIKSYDPLYDFHEISNGIAEDLPDLDSVELSAVANYIFIGEGLFLDSTEMNRMLRFVAGGNNAFISSKDIPFQIKTTIFKELCSDYWFYQYPNISDSVATLSFNHPSLVDTISKYDFKYISHREVRDYRWHYVESEYFCDEYYSPVALGQLNDTLINYFKIQYGVGHFYFHTNPIAFSNIQLLKASSVDYASLVFSHLPAGDIYWDSESRLPLGIARSLDRNNRDGNMDRNLNSEGPLSYILSQPPLAWAWYTALATASLFLIFRSRRKQRVIPVAVENKNSSLEFINTIGRIYYQQGNHRKICLKKMKLFLAFIRDRYYLNTSEQDADFFTRLAAKSEIPASVINKIFLYHKNIENANAASEETLIDFHLEMDKFYKNCK